MSELLIRLTGLLLSVLVLCHLLAVHLLTDVAHTTSSYALRRWLGWYTIAAVVQHALAAH